MLKALRVAESIATVCLSVAAVVFLWLQIAGADGSRVSRVDTPKKGLEDISSQRLEMVLPGNSLGILEGGPILVEFSDFQCPFCGRFARDTFTNVKESLVDTHLTAYGFMHFPLTQIHSDALGSAEAAACADLQGRFWRVHDFFFANQADLKSAVQQVEKLGVNHEALTKCLAEQGPTKVQGEIAEAKRLGVVSTPTFLVGRVGTNGRVAIMRRLSGFTNLDGIRKAIDGVAAKKG